MMITGRKDFSSWTYSDYTLEGGGTLAVSLLNAGDQIHCGFNYWDGRPVFVQYDEDSLVAQVFDENNTLIDCYAVDLCSGDDEDFTEACYYSALAALAKRLRGSGIENASFIVKH